MAHTKPTRRKEWSMKRLIQTSPSPQRETGVSLPTDKI